MSKRPMCDPARYNKMVTIRQLDPSAVPNARNEVDKSDPSNWIEYTSSYAECQTKGGREKWQSEQVEPSTDEIWDMPYSAKLAAATSAMRLRFNGQDREILTVENRDQLNAVIRMQVRLGT